MLPHMKTVQIAGYDIKATLTVTGIHTGCNKTNRRCQATQIKHVLCAFTGLGILWGLGISLYAGRRPLRT